MQILKAAAMPLQSATPRGAGASHLRTLVAPAAPEASPLFCSVCRRPLRAVVGVGPRTLVARVVYRFDALWAWALE